MSFGGKIMKRRRDKGVNSRQKGRTGKEKGKKKKEKEKIIIKRVI